MGASCGKCGQQNSRATPEIQSENIDPVVSSIGDKVDHLPTASFNRQLSSKTVKRRSSQKPGSISRDFRTQASRNIDELENIETFTEVDSADRLNPQVSMCQPIPTEEMQAFLKIFEQECLEKAVEILRKRQQTQKPTRGSAMSSIPSRASQTGSVLSGSRVKLRLDKGFVRVLHKNINDCYQFLQKLGQGSFGSVHKAICLKTNQERAIKIIRKGKSNKMEETLFGELELLKTLDHPNIIKLYDIFDFRDFFYVVTEYCDGGELFAAVKRNHHFSERDASVILKQLLSAVNYMHSRGVVHRDLKPENIVFESVVGTDLSDSRIKIIDFGTAETIKKGKNLTARVGSPFYVAPQVLAQNYNIKCDIWSCGVILYVLLSGYPPFRGRSHEEIFANIARSSVSFDDKVWNNISKEAKALVKLMLDRNVGRRITAEDALNYPWIQQCTRIEPIGEEALLNMEQFFFKNKFVAVIETYLAANAISAAERNELAEKFKQIDKDGNGTLEKAEIVEAYKSIYGIVDEQVITHIIDTIDINGSGKIDFTEFIVATSNRDKLFQRKGLEQAFDYFDTVKIRQIQDKTGFIEATELRELLGGSCDNDQVAKIFEQLDENGDHQISKDEFIAKLLPQ